MYAPYASSGNREIDCLGYLLQPLASAAASAASRRRSRSRLQAAVVAVMALSLSAQVAWSAQCKPHHFRTPYFIKTMGRCGFDHATMSFHGDGVEQARCLMRGMDETRNLGPQMAMMPAPLADRVGNEAGLPTRGGARSYLSKLDLEWDFAELCGCRYRAPTTTIPRRQWHAISSSMTPAGPI